jgi:hypothetical protein
MGTNNRRFGSALLAVAIGSLSVVLIVVLSWAVIGKHGLDPDARWVYKVTRVVTTTSEPLILALPFASTWQDLPPADDCYGESVQPPSAVQVACGWPRAAAARAPPLS